MVQQNQREHDINIVYNARFKNTFRSLKFSGNLLISNVFLFISLKIYKSIVIVLL